MILDPRIRYEQVLRMPVTRPTWKSRSRPRAVRSYSAWSPWRLIGRTVAQNRLAIVGVAVVVLVTLFSFVGPLLYHTDQSIPTSCTSICGRVRHPLGTNSGFDISAG